MLSAASMASHRVLIHEETSGIKYDSMIDNPKSGYEKALHFCSCTYVIGSNPIMLVIFLRPTFGAERIVNCASKHHSMRIDTRREH